jgi:hypothetical protein
MFAGDDESDPNAEKMTEIRERKDELEESARSIGLYLEDWAPLATGHAADDEDNESGETQVEDILLHCVFTVGDLAFSDRVQVDDESQKLKDEFEAIMTAGVHDQAIDARERLRRSGLIDEEDL